MLSRDAFLEQYRTFRQWVFGFLSTPYKGEFLHTTGYRLRKAGQDGPTWIASTSDVREAGRWQHYIPRPGTVAHSKAFGKVVVVDTLTEANISRVYQHVLTTPLAEIRCLGIWHMVASFHRCIHMNRSSESIAESAGSILSFIDSKWRSGPSMPASYVVSSAMVRMAGIRGLGGEDGMLATSLNMHFASSGPEGWHFQTARPLAPGSACRKAEIVREVRQALLPPWIQFTVRDLARTRRMRFARKLPFPRAVTGQAIDPKTPSLAIGSSDDGAGAPAATSKLRRDALQSAVDASAPCRIPDEVWRTLGLSALSLPSHLRPGTYGR